MVRLLSIAAALVAVSVSAKADFSYEQTSKVTGGMMAGMMKFAGAFSKQANEPMQTTVSVQGDRMAMSSRQRLSIIDLKAETLTEVDFEKKTYGVITFADFSKALARMNEKIAKGDANVTFKADVKQTGVTKNINGFQAKEAILTVDVEGQDKKSGNTGAMNVWTDMWLAPVSGYDEVKSFYQRMAQKLDWTPGSGGMFGGQAGMMRGMSQVAKEASKLEGVPVLQVIRMKGAANGMSESDMEKMQAAQAQADQAQQQSAPPTAGSVAGDAATGAATGAATSKMGRFGGLAGGLGGFGKRKKEQDQAAAPAQQQQTPPPAPVGPAGPTPPGTMIEMTTEITAFSSAPVDAAKFSVPSGFKQVDHEMTKMAR